MKNLLKNTLFIAALMLTIQNISFAEVCKEDAEVTITAEEAVCSNVYMISVHEVQAVIYAIANSDQIAEEDKCIPIRHYKWLLVQAGFSLSGIHDPLNCGT